MGNERMFEGTRRGRSGKMQKRVKRGRRDKAYERMHTTIMPLVFVAHVATVIVPVTDPG